MVNRIDETWHRLREWTYGSAPAERLAAQILYHEGFEAIDPSHPLGGKDGGQDARCMYAGEPWSMAVYFPRGEKDYQGIKTKFLSDAEKVKQQNATGIAFVTNQELRLSERKELENSANLLKVELFHLERIAGILDRPEMESVKRQFLSINTDASPTINNLGGTGGNAPGAGGGGGGAIGEARGGNGGSGGNIYNFSGTPGSAPGAGGGGAGAFGPGSQGGEGGQGGDTSFGDIVAKGGKGGKAGFSVIVSREVSEVDRDAGLHISTLMLVECCHFRDGLAYILAAGVEHVTFAKFPGRFRFVLFGILSIGNATLGVEYELTASFESPNSDAVWFQPFKVFSGPPRRIAKPCFALLVDCEVDQPGIWTILIHSSGHCFGRLPIEVITPSS